MSTLRKEELKENLRNIGFVYALVISIVLAVFLVKMVKQEMASNRGRIVNKIESVSNSPYPQN